MLGIVGCLTPEILGLSNGVWWQAGSGIFSDGGIDYLGDPNLVHAQSIIAILGVQARAPAAFRSCSRLPAGAAVLVLVLVETCQVQC